MLILAFHFLPFFNNFSSLFEFFCLHVSIGFKIGNRRLRKWQKLRAVYKKSTINNASKMAFLEVMFCNYCPKKLNLVTRVDSLIFLNVYSYLVLLFAYTIGLESNVGRLTLIIIVNFFLQSPQTQNQDCELTQQLFSKNTQKRCSLFTEKIPEP